VSEIFVKGILGKYFLESVQSSSQGMLILYVVLACVLPAAVGYLLGSVNSAVLISRVFYRDDIRLHGSKNAGMTNMMRTYGIAAAIGTLIGDMLKTVLSVLLGALLLAEMGMYIGGLFSVLGHVFPLYFRFKGGKGVACAAAMVLCTEPLLFVVLMLLFVGIVALSRYISLGSVMCIMVYPLFLNRMYPVLHKTGGVPFVPTVVSFVLMVVVLLMHRENIRRLSRKEESKFEFKKSKKAEETVCGPDPEDGTDDVSQNGQNERISRNKRK